MAAISKIVITRAEKGFNDLKLVDTIFSGETYRTGDLPGRNQNADFSYVRHGAST